MSVHVLLENVPRATGQGLIFSECMKYGTVEGLHWDPNSFGQYESCEALVTYDTAETAQTAAKKLSKRMSLFGSDVPIEVTVVDDDKAESFKAPKAVEDLIDASGAMEAGVIDSAEHTAETGLQIREKVRDRHREAPLQDDRADDDRYRRPRDRVRDRTFEAQAREDRVRFEDQRDADMVDRYHRQDKRPKTRRFVERRTDSREGRAQPAASRRTQRSRAEDFQDPDGPPDAGPSSSHRKRRREVAPDPEYSDYSDGDADPAAKPAVPREVVKPRGLSGFDKKGPAPEPTGQAIIGASLGAAVGAASLGTPAGTNVTTRGNWAEIQSGAMAPYYGNLMTGAKTPNRPPEFGQAAAAAAAAGMLPGAGLKIAGTQMNSNVYVGMMPLGISELEFRSLFAPYGAIMSTRMMGTRNGGVCGFVKYTSYAEAQMAINNMNGLAIAGTKLKVKLADQDNLGFNPAILRLQQTTGLPTASI